MVCRLFHAEPLSEMIIYYWSLLLKSMGRNFCGICFKHNNFHTRSLFETDGCKMAVIFPPLQYVKEVQNLINIEKITYNKNMSLVTICVRRLIHWSMIPLDSLTDILTPLFSFTKEVNPRLAKHPFVFNGRLDNPGITSLVKEDTCLQVALYGGVDLCQHWFR